MVRVPRSLPPAVLWRKANHQKKGNIKYSRFHLVVTLASSVLAGIVGALAFRQNGVVK
jgi:hypothetical protein